MGVFLSLISNAFEGVELCHFHDFLDMPFDDCD